MLGMVKDVLIGSDSVEFKHELSCYDEVVGRASVAHWMHLKIPLNHSLSLWFVFLTFLRNLQSPIKQE